MLGPGSKLGRYELRDALGAGGMSAVYRAYDPVLDREIAIKVLPGNLAREPVYRKRFQEEARALARVDHPNLVRIYAVGQEGSVSYYAMELVQGLALRDVIRSRRRFTLREAMAVFGQFLKGLAAVHDAAIVHRDVKPGNIMLSASGRAILMDFGLARRIERQALTAPGAVVGTPEYMAPEQAKGEKADARADLYAAGIVLYEMLSGTPPYGGPDTLAILRKHVEAPIPSFREVIPDLPQQLDAVLRRFLAKRPEERFPDTHAAYDALLPWMPGERESEAIVRQVVSEAQRMRRRRTQSFVPPPPQGSAAPQTAGTPGNVLPAGSRPTARSGALSDRNWLAWTAMAVAVIAVAVAILSLFRSAPPRTGAWRRVTLRDGNTFAGRIIRWEPLPNGDAKVTYRTRRGVPISTKASRIRFDEAARSRPWVPFVAVLIAFGAVLAVLTVLLVTHLTARPTAAASGVARPSPRPPPPTRTPPA